MGSPLSGLIAGASYIRCHLTKIILPAPHLKNIHLGKEVMIEPATGNDLPFADVLLRKLFLLTF